MNNRPTSPLSGPSPVPTSGSASVSVQPTTATFSALTERPVLTAKQAADKIYNGKAHNPEKRINSRSGEIHQQRKLEIAQLTAELAKKEQRYSMRPRVNYIDTLSAKSAVEAAYIKHWVDTVERTGNLNYPDEARRRKLSGSLILHVLLNNDGKVVTVEIGLGSGQQVLDDAATRIVTLAAPFKPFPEQMRVAYDQLMITRTWVFQGGDSLVTQ
jgi:protein TonB